MSMWMMRRETGAPSRKGGTCVAGDDITRQTVVRTKTSPVAFLPVIKNGVRPCFPAAFAARDPQILLDGMTPMEFILRFTLCQIVLREPPFFREKDGAGGETPLACNPPGAPSSFRASTTKQRLLAEARPAGRNNKELDDPGVESVRELFKNSDSRVFRGCAPAG